MRFPELDASITVAAGHDLDDLWDRFEVFEALHHTMTIDNPMTSDDLDAVVDLLAPEDGDSALDLACGHGELLRRLRRQAAIIGRGVDLSPWMLHTAHRLTADRATDLSWMLDDAKHHGRDERFDIATCLGASWIWHGFPSTVRAITHRTSSGGRIAIGDMHLRAGLDPQAVSKTHGALESIDELDRCFADNDIELLGRINTSDEAWDTYLARTELAAASWLELHPGDRAQSYLDDQRAWQEDHERDREILTWSVWVGKKR